MRGELVEKAGKAKITADDKGLLDQNKVLIPGRRIPLTSFTAQTTYVL